MDIIYNFNLVKMWKHICTFIFATVMLFVMSCSDNVKTKNEADTNKIIETELSEQASTIQNDTNFHVDEDMLPQYPGGYNALKEYLKKNISYPESERASGIQGQVFVGFFIETDGRITDIQIEESLSKALDEAAVAAIKKMPNWIPAIKGGNPERVKHILPVMFRFPRPEPEVENKN